MICMKTKQLLNMQTNGIQKMNGCESEELINEISVKRCKEEFW